MQKLFQQDHQDPVQWTQLRSRGTVTVESHMNLGPPEMNLSKRRCNKCQVDRGPRRSAARVKAAEVEARQKLRHRLEQPMNDIKM